MKEIWKDIIGFDDYKVNNYGRIKSFKYKKERILKPSFDSFGYECYVLRKDNKSINIRGHVAVAIAFLGYVRNGTTDIVVDHIDGNPSNNNLDNLQLITHRQNICKSKKGSSKYNGVSWHIRHKKWISSIQVNGVRNHLGYFSTEEEAKKAYDKFF